MFKLQHGSRDRLAFVKSIKIDCTGLDVSFTDEQTKAMSFVSRAVAIEVSKALRHSHGNFYPVEG